MTYLFSLYDRVADEFGPVFEQKSEAVAVRGIRQYFRNAPQMIPGDFQLIKVGNVDKDGSKCLIKALEPKIVWTGDMEDGR